MQCMKCGKQTTEQSAFCPTCLSVMEKYPVKPHAKVVIPERAKGSARPARRQRSPEQIIAAQRRRIRRLRRVNVFLALLLALSIGVIAWRLFQEQYMAPLGSNYSTVESMVPANLP